LARPKSSIVTYPTFIWRTVAVTLSEFRRDLWVRKPSWTIVVCVILGLTIFVELPTCDRHTMTAYTAQA